VITRRILTVTSFDELRRVLDRAHVATNQRDERRKLRMAKARARARRL